MFRNQVPSVSTNLTARWCSGSWWFAGAPKHRQHVTWMVGLGCVSSKDVCLPMCRLSQLKDIMLVQYDQDVVTWSPQGRIHQIEYAMEAVKQGSAVVGLKVRSGLLFI